MDGASRQGWRIGFRLDGQETKSSWLASDKASLVCQSWLWGWLLSSEDLSVFQNWLGLGLRQSRKIQCNKPGGKVIRVKTVKAL